MENNENKRIDWYDEFREIEKKFKVYEKNKFFVDGPLVSIRLGTISNKIDVENQGKDLDMEEISKLRNNELKKKTLLSFFDEDYGKIVEKFGVSCIEDAVRGYYSVWPNFSVDVWIPKRKSLMQEVKESVGNINYYLSNAPREHKVVLGERLEGFKKEYERFLDL